MADNINREPDPIWDRSAHVLRQHERRVAELEDAMRKALKRAKAGGMDGWPAFVAMRKTLEQ